MEEINPNIIKEHALDFLKNNETAVLSTVDPKNKPHAATVYYIVENDFTFYIVSSAESQKVLNIKNNKETALAIGFGPSPITVQAGGEAEIISGYKYLEIMKKVGYENIGRWPVFLIGKGDFIVIKIKPKWLVLLNLDKDGNPKTYKKGFHKII